MNLFFLKISIAIIVLVHIALRPCMAEDIIFMYNPFGRLKYDVIFEEYLRLHRPNAKFYSFKINPDNDEEMQQVIADIRKRQPSLIYIWGTLASLKIAGTIEDMEQKKGNYITDIPIVVMSVTQPAVVGLVRDLTNPGRNVTGISHIVPIPLQLDAIRRYRPFTKLGMVYNPLEPNSIWVRDVLTELAENNKFSLVAYPVSTDIRGNLQPESIPGLLKKIKTQGVDWLYLGPDAYVAGTHRKTVVDTCWDIKLPIFSTTAGPAIESKALLGLFVRHHHLGAHAGRKAKLILEGKNPATIPIETPQLFSLVVNMDAAEHLGMLPPTEMLDLAEIARPLTQGKMQ